MPSEAWLDQIDRLLAEKVMEWRLLTQHYLEQFGGASPEIWEGADGKATLYANGWHPTRDHGQALMVFERCEDMQLDHAWGAHGHVYRAERIDRVTKEVRHWDTAETPMLAIVLAALKWAGVEVPSDQT